MSVFKSFDEAGDNPEPIVNRYLQTMADGGEQLALLRVSYRFTPYWLPEAAYQRLAGFYLLLRDGERTQLFMTVTEANSPADVWLRQQSIQSEQQFAEALAQWQLPCIDSAEPLPLISVNIAKPWGQEIWFTGIEQRGVAKVGDERGQQLLPWVLSALPEALCDHQQQSLILLKILDPMPEPVFGELYFELHQQKREVYVVTHVDADAWPQGRGAIRFGFSADKRAQYASEADFRAAFAGAVKAYETVRRDIDRQLDAVAAKDGYAVDQALPLTQRKAMLAELPDELRQRELNLRSAVESFTDSLPLAVGDVIKVPCLTPHSLQHGVRTVEFQTPVYERLIIYFTQKVLTQDHWDTDQAVALMNTETPPPEPEPVIVENGAVIIKRIVDFEDFEVHRIQLRHAQKWRLQTQRSYCLLMAIDAGLQVNRRTLGAEQAILIPARCETPCLRNGRDDGMLSALVAYPKFQ